MRYDKTVEGKDGQRPANISHPSLAVILAGLGSDRRVFEPETRHLIDTICELINGN